MKRTMNLVGIVLAVSIGFVFADGQLADIVTKADFQAKVLQSPRPVVVKFWATWCPSCKNMRSVIDRIAWTNKGKYDFVAVDIDKGKALVSEYNIKGIPAFLFFKAGVQVGHTIGEMTQNELQSEIDNALRR